MRNADDTQTMELPLDTWSKATSIVTVVTKKRGRPALHADPADRQRAYMARNGIVPMTVQLPEALHEEFMTWLTSKGKKQSTVIAHLIRTQILRKR